MTEKQLPAFLSCEVTEDGFALRAALACPMGEARCLAVAAASWVREAVGGGAGILWPNHVVLDGRRVCAITCRASGDEIIFSFRPAPEAVPLAPEVFLARVLEAAGRDLADYPSNRPELMQRYCEHCRTVMKFVNVVYRGMPLYGFAFAVDRHGGLMVMTQESRTVVTLYGGEAEIVKKGEEPESSPDLPVMPGR